MKKIIILLFLPLICFSLVRAQVLPMVVDWKLWTTVDDYNYNIYGEPYTPETYFVKFEGDTLIGGLNYFKIMLSEDVDTIDFSCVGYARQTVDNQKVFYRNLEGDEGCVYDFSASQGDTITDLYNPLREHLFYDDFSLVVDSVYFVNINGNNHRAFDLIRIDYPEAKETIIEGIGSECGVLEVGHAFSGAVGWSLSLLCYWENDALAYHSDSYDFCFYDDNMAGVNIDWATDGAKWYYSQTLLNPDYITYTYIESVKDTVINDTTCKQLVEFRYDMSTNEQMFFKEFFMFNDNSRVYYYSSDKNRFCLLYDFSKQTGESWVLDEFPYSNEDGFDNRVYVDSVSNWIINGENRIVQFVHMEDQALCFGNDVIIEGIGNLNYMFPFCELSDIGPLRCYEDDLLGNYHVAEADDCTHQYLSNEKYISNSDSYRIYPNPVKETLTIINSSLPKLETINVEIYSITGLKLLSKCLIEATEIDVSNYSAGIYFILIKQNDKIFHKEKIIVE